MMTPPKARIHLLDIFSKVGSFSPNTLRARACFQQGVVPWSVSFISFADIATTLQSLGVKPNNNVPHGPSYTLPAIVIPGNSTVPENVEPHTAHFEKYKVISGSLPIAHYVDYASGKLWGSSSEPGLFPLGDAIVHEVETCITKAIIATRPIITPLTPKILDDRGRRYFIRTRKEWLNLPPNARSLTALRPRTKRERDDIWTNISNALSPLMTKPLLWTHGDCEPEISNMSYTEILFFSYLEWFTRVAGWQSEWYGRFVDLLGTHHNIAPNGEHAEYVWSHGTLMFQEKGSKRKLEDVVKRWPN